MINGKDRLETNVPETADKQRKHEILVREVKKDHGNLM